MMTKSRHRSNRPLRMMECLEDRCLMTGNVSAVVSNGTLYLQGDVGNNDIQIEQVGGKYVVTPTFGTQLNYRGTLPNGQQPRQEFVATSIVALMNGGNDVITFKGITSSTNVKIDLGAGLNSVVTGRMNVSRDLTITALGSMNVQTLGNSISVGGATTIRALQPANGNDDIRLLGSFNTLTIDTQAGNDTVVLGSGYPWQYNTLTANTVYVYTGGGDDVLNVRNATIRDRIWADLGAGNDRLGLSYVSLPLNRQNARFDGNLGLDTITGNVGVANYPLLLSFP